MSTEHTVQVIERFPDVRVLPVGTTLGYHHYRLPDKTILIPGQFVKIHKDEIGTETRFTRDWMAAELPIIRRKREIWMAAEVAQPPLFARFWRGHGVYVDIERAYPSIYERIGWDVEYKRLSYYSSISTLRYPLPINWKVGRSMPVSSNRTGWARVWDGKTVKAHRFINKQWSPGLRMAVLDILQSIARFAVDVFGASYVNVDGAIVPEGQALDYIRFLGVLGLHGRIKYRGDGLVLGTHAIQIGEKMIGAGMSAPKDFSNLIFSTHEAAWLLGKFAK
jgi:hypothetical protein